MLGTAGCCSRAVTERKKSCVLKWRDISFGNFHTFYPMTYTMPRHNYYVWQETPEGEAWLEAGYPTSLTHKHRGRIIRNECYHLSDGADFSIPTPSDTFWCFFKPFFLNTRDHLDGKSKLWTLCQKELAYFSSMLYLNWFVEKLRPTVQSEVRILLLLFQHSNSGFRSKQAEQVLS